MPTADQGPNTQEDRCAITSADGEKVVMVVSVSSVSQMTNAAARRQRPSQPAVFSNDAALITATHSRPVQYSQNHAYRQEAPTRLPHSFLAEGPRASRALSASRASSSPNSTGSSPAWPSPCRGRPSGRRGRTRRATMRACGLRPARRRASSACSCAGADQHRPNRNTRQDAPPSPHANPRLQLLGGFAGRTGPKRHNTPAFPQVGEAGSEQLPPKTAQKSRPMAKSAPVSCETI